MRYLLDALCMQTRGEAHAYLKEKLQLPEYYGNNLDALYDCVSERKDMEIEVRNLTGIEERSYVWRVINVLQNAGAKVL